MFNKIYNSPHKRAGASLIIRRNTMAKAKAKAKTDERKIVSIKIFCDVKKKYTDIVMCEWDFEHSDEPCDTCGSHGHLSYYVVKCPLCGKSHTVSISTW
jgi:hypothetical protein